MAVEGPRRARAPRGAANVADAPATTSPLPSPAASPPNPAGAADVFVASRDLRTRVGVTAVGASPTQTAVPRLLDDWRSLLWKAEAEDRADAEVLAPPLDAALQQAEHARGEPLGRRERRAVEAAVRQQLQQPWDAAFAAHFADVTRSPSTKRQAERDVVLEQRARIAQLKDPFTPVIDNAPGARDAEIVLWENRNVVVLVDTWAPSPKALVVPKAPVSLPTDAPASILDELALVAAHVSDAFLRSTGCPAAGIWINPPQHLTVRQLHVHVLPDLGPYTADGLPALKLLDDAALRPQLIAWFDAIGRDLQGRLGPPAP
jgi:diadenosine tetraphosphate (Ap4A) HIT family hydrolase